MSTENLTLSWAVLCNRTLIDSNTHTVSIIDVLERLNVEVNEQEVVYPFIVPVRFDIVSYWRRLEKTLGNTADARVEILNPDGGAVAKVDFSFEFAGGSLTVRHILSLNGLQVSKQGTYEIVVYGKEQFQSEYTEYSRIPLEVEIKSQADKS